MGSLFGLQVAAGAVPSEMVRVPPFRIAVNLSDQAGVRLRELNETVVVAASFSGAAGHNCSRRTRQLCGPAAGFLDGRAGLALCVFHAFQEFMVGLKLAELRRLSS